MDSGSIAIDIALIPGPCIQQEILSWNAQIKSTWEGGFLFDSDHLPHLTLLQAYIPSSSADQFHSDVKSVVARLDLSEFRTLELEDVIETPFRGELSVFGLGIRRTEALQRLHDKLIKIGRDYHVLDGCEQSFFDRKANEESCSWVRRYPQVKGGPNFHPHITLGFGDARSVRPLASSWNVPRTLRLAELLSAQLGDCCTVSSNIFVRWSL